MRRVFWEFICKRQLSDFPAHNRRFSGCRESLECPQRSLILSVVKSQEGIKNDQDCLFSRDTGRLNGVNGSSRLYDILFVIKPERLVSFLSGSYPYKSGNFG